MRFCEKLNDYIERLDCTAKEIGELADISPATLSRYRSGERIPEIGSRAFEKLCAAVSDMYAKKNIDESVQSVKESFLECDDLITADKEQLCRNFDVLVTVLDLNLAGLCKRINYDISMVSRFRSGTRRPSEPEKFAATVADYIAEKRNSPADIKTLCELFECESEELCKSGSAAEKIKNWLLFGDSRNMGENGSVLEFLNKLDEFDLNKYIKVIHFDEMKVPTLPFQLPTSKMYYGIKDMMESELDFLKATVLSKSKKPVTLYSDMPMLEMASDPDFPKKWMYGMALLLKKGLHLNNIHNLDRPFEEMMLGLESWIPMYMTGQISPYYLKKTQSGAFHHFLRVSGAAALSGEAVSGHHADGRYYLSKNKEDIAYYQKRADDLLENASPLMEIYRSNAAGKLNAFLVADAERTEKGLIRKNILSVPSIFTAGNGFLKQMLKNHNIPEVEADEILGFVARSRSLAEKHLAAGCINDVIHEMTMEEYEGHPVNLPLSGMFYEKDIFYTYEEYCEHLKQAREFAGNNKNYSIAFSSGSTFGNLQITLCKGEWAMISKANAPAIHFVVFHPRLRNAIENFVPPITEE
mgnify:FL=1